MRKKATLLSAMAMAMASGWYQRPNPGTNNFDAAEWLRRNRERIENGKVRKQIQPKKDKPHSFKVTYSKGKPPKFG